MISLIQHFEADFLWKVSLKILNSGIILNTFTHGFAIIEGQFLAHMAVVYKIVNRSPCLHAGIRRFAGIYAYCRYFIDRIW